MIFSLQSLTDIPQNPTLNWALVIAVSSLVSAVVFLFKKIENKENINKELRDKHEERLLIHAKEIQVLLEKALIGFNEVEKKIYEVNNESQKEVTQTILAGQKSIVQGLEKLLQKMNEKNNNGS